jgi:hypothetical protein
MPGFDGTGPVNKGPMTGRGSGYCLSYVDTGIDFPPRFGRGGARGRRNCFYATGLPRWARARQSTFPAGAVYAPPVSGERELEMLREQVINLESALEQAKKRVKELESK